MEAKMLAVPRPQTRADCQHEARPCPWVGCRHHLLLELAEAKTRTHDVPRPTALRMNGAERGEARCGRRAGLRSSAAGALVRTWIDEAVERLSSLEFTCSLDVVDAYPDGLSPARIAEVLGVAEQLIDKQVREAKAAEKRALELEFRDRFGGRKGPIVL